MGIYATVAELRDEVDADAATLPDAEAERLIRDAETIVDHMLGPWPVQEDGPSEGRKIVEADVSAWRWQRLKEATLNLAAKANAQPNFLGQAFESVSGPDFSYSKRVGGLLGTDFVVVLEASGLRIRGGRARP